jgi:chemotaxis methyl-accepting protein methylase
VTDGFEPTVRKGTLDRLSRALAPDGWLVLGLDEACPEGFHAAGVSGIYRRKIASVKAA